MIKKALFTISILLFCMAPISAQPSDFTSVAEKAIPAVVSVKVEINQKAAQPFFGMPDRGGDPFFGDEFWNRFFNMPKEQQRQAPPSLGQGSGFLVSEDGYILTNNHIVENAGKVTVTLKNGKEYSAKVIGNDPNTDVAVIKIEGSGFPFLKLGDSSKLKVGQWVAAIGNPLGLQATLTVGVVSAIDRNNLGLTQVEDFIQTDAAINRGNSGGPLMNMNGEAIGINAAIATNTGGYMGIGFAIPSNLAAHIMEQLVQNGSFTRGYMGVVLQQVDPDLAEAFGLESTQGALIAEVAKDSPADKAGLKRGDIIVKYNGRPVENISVVRNAVSIMKPNEVITLEVKRGDKVQSFKVTVGSHPSNAQAQSGFQKKLGLKVTELTPEIAQSYGYVGEKGVVVTQVEGGSIASLAGIKKGSLILSVNKKDVLTADEFNKAVSDTPESKPLLLLIKQGSVTQYITLKVN